MYYFSTWDGNVSISTEKTNELLIGLAQVHSASIEEAAIRKYLPSVNLDTIPVCCDLPDPSADASLVAVFSDENKHHRLAKDLRNYYQVKAFFSKRSDLDLGIDKRDAAIKKFMESEESCSTTNDTFRAWRRGLFQFRPRVESVLHGAQRKIAKLLGECPKWDEITTAFGPGATTQLPKRMACAKVKLSQPLACSGDMTVCLSQALSSLPHLLPEGDDSVTATVEIHHGKLVTVPKTWKTDRTVMIEPWLNSFFQLGVGRIIADRLVQVGVDVRDQEKNKSLARSSSISGDLATLDLSSASDSIAVELVRHLLPPDWYDLLSVLRTSSCDIDGRVITLAKFSSMGNGFTFPLESLIFWAIVSSVKGCAKRTYVYGDDILCPTESAPDVIEALECLGFSINPEKSFTSGYFRESCGGDYFFGINVRPIYIKDAMTGQDAFRLHNYYVRTGQLNLANIVRSWIDPALILWGPDGYGDGHLIVDPLLGYPENDPDFKYRSKKLRKRGWGGYLFDTYAYSKRLLKRKLKLGDRILPVYSIYTRESIETGGTSHVISSMPSNRQFTKDGTPIEILPGVSGYKRIVIYYFG